MSEREFWGWIDSRNGRRVSITSTFTREQAERELQGWLARDARGGRPDLHDLMPHVIVVRLTPTAPEQGPDSTYQT